MNESNKTYACRGGQQFELEKNLDQMLVRQLPGSLEEAAIVSSKQVFSAFTRRMTSKTELQNQGIGALDSCVWRNLS